MRNILTRQFPLVIWLTGCGAATGLQTGSADVADASAPNGSETGGSTMSFGGAATETSGGSGGSIDVTYPYGGYVSMTGGSPSLPTGGRVAYTGGARPTGGTKSTGGASSTGGARPTGGTVSTGGTNPTSGTASMGGTKLTGGTAGTGGTKSTGGTVSTGGTKSTGGTVSTGGTKSTGGTAGTGGSTATGTMKIGVDGYAWIPAGMYVLHGYVYSFAGGSLTYVKLDYGTYTSFCASGDVAANPTYISYAGVGLNVNQTTSSSDSTVQPLVINAKYVVVSFTNPGGSPLRLQLNDASGDRWCYDLSNTSSPASIPLTAFNTHCWDNSGAAFAPGTAITSIEMLVPGDAVVDRPFNFCLLGLTFQ
jgi:hypothetical protein